MTDFVAQVLIVFCLWLVVASFTVLPRLFKRGKHERGRHKDLT